MSKTMISIIMITYNHEKYIHGALMSAIAQQNESCGIEILIVDDGSSDRTVNIIQEVQSKFPEIVFPTFKEHAGVTAINKNLNEQIRKARGNYIGFLAGDDEYYPDRFASQLNIFEEDSDVMLIYSMGNNFNDDGVMGACQGDDMIGVLEKQNVGSLYDYIINNVPSIFVQGALIKKDLVSAAEFDEEVIADDWALNIRMLMQLRERKKRYRFIKEVTFLRRLHNSNTSYNVDHQIPRMIQIVEKYSPKEIRRYFIGKIYINNMKNALIQYNIFYSMRFFILSFVGFPKNIAYFISKVLEKI
ncbi:MAG: glycosyltransferase family 2 protein [Candidatus Pacearchaeota archaeon]|nr:glycosyltransferase family 2 protein [Candidatus Pacearchaeota archaeon]